MMLSLAGWWSAKDNLSFLGSFVCLEDSQGTVRHNVRPGLKQTIRLELPTVATFIWFSGAWGSLTRVTSDSHANALKSSASQLTGTRNRCEVASPSLIRTHAGGVHQSGAIGWDLDDVTLRDAVSLTAPSTCSPPFLFVC